MGQQTYREEELSLPGSDYNRRFRTTRLAVRFAIVGLLIFCLTLFVHFREVRIESLELNTPSPRYVVAQVDFSFYDEQATVIMRQEAIRDVGKIYELTEKSIRKVRTDLENNLQEQQEGWRGIAANTTFEELYQGIDLLEKILSHIRFTDPRTFKKIGEMGLESRDYLVFVPSLQNDDENETEISKRIWQQIQQVTFADSPLSDEAIDFLVSYFSLQKYAIIEDVSAERTLRQKIQAQVPKKYTRVSAGNRIIDKNEEVTERHIEMLNRMKQVLAEERSLLSPRSILGSLILAAVICVIAGTFLWTYQPHAIVSNRLLLLLVTLTVLALILAKVVDFIVFSNYSNLIYLFHYPLIIPLPALLMCILLSPSIAALTSMFLAIVLSISIPVEKQGFLITNLTTALVAIMGARHLEHRGDIFLVCTKCWSVCALLIFANNLYEGTYNQPAMMIDFASTAFFMFITSILTVGLLPLFETGFKVMTNLTLMEYLDPNHPLLRRMAHEAPGTYQHSIVVGNLAEAAAAAIDANALYCRVAALFHDVGKVITPQYFTENQQTELNIHQLLTPEESAQVIMDHVHEGFELAKRAKLPWQIIDGILEHHGTTLVYFFYRKQLDLMGGDVELVDMGKFRYAGPKPQSRETAILMIADTFEAASRSLREVNEAVVTDLMNKLVRHKEEDGQFDECTLTFRELAIVKRTMIKSLLASSHARIDYPEQPLHTLEEEIES